MADVVVMQDADDQPGAMEQPHWPTGIPGVSWSEVTDFSVGRAYVATPLQFEWAVVDGSERLLTVRGPTDGQPARIEVGPGVEVEAAARHLFDLVNQWLAAGRVS